MKPIRSSTIERARSKNRHRLRLFVFRADQAWWEISIQRTRDCESAKTIGAIIGNALKEAGFLAEMMVQDRLGRIKNVATYGRDPRETKG